MKSEEESTGTGHSERPVLSMRLAAATHWAKAKAESGTLKTQDEPLESRALKQASKAKAAKSSALYRFT